MPTITIQTQPATESLANMVGANPSAGFSVSPTTGSAVISVPVTDPADWEVSATGGSAELSHAVFGGGAGFSITPTGGEASITSSIKVAEWDISPTTGTADISSGPALSGFQVSVDPGGKADISSANSIGFEIDVEAGGKADLTSDLESAGWSITPDASGIAEITGTVFTAGWSISPDTGGKAEITGNTLVTSDSCAIPGIRDNGSIADLISLLFGVETTFTVPTSFVARLLDDTGVELTDAGYSAAAIASGSSAWTSITTTVTCGSETVGYVGVRNVLPITMGTAVGGGNIKYMVLEDQSGNELVRVQYGPSAYSFSAGENFTIPSGSFKIGTEYLL